MQSRESPGTTTSKHLRKMGGLIKETETNFLNNTPITTYGNLNTKKTPWISGQRIKEFIVANQIKNAKFKGRFSITKYRSKDVVFTSNNKQYTDLVCINQEKQYPLKEQQQTSLNDNSTSIQIDNNNYNRNQVINNVHSNPPETSPSFFNQTVIHKKGKLSTYILKPNETRNKKTIHPSKSVGVFVSLKGTTTNNNTSYTNEKEDIQTTTFDMNSINSNSNNNANTYMQNRIQNKNDYVIQLPRTRQQQSRSRSRSKGHNNNNDNNNNTNNNNNNDNSRYSSNSNGKGSFYEISTSPIHMNSNNNNNISQNDSSCDNNILFNKAPSTNHDYEKYTSPSQKRTNNTYYSQYSRTPMYSYSGNKSHENEDNKNMRKYKPYSGGKIDFIRPIDVYDNIKKNHIDKVIFIQRFMKAKLNKNGNCNDDSSNNNSICRSGIDDAIITSKGDLLTSLLNKYVKNVVDSKRVMKYVFERIKNKSGINNNSHSKNSINKQRKGIKRKASPIVTNFKYCPDEHVNTINEITKQILTNKPNTLLQTQQTPQFTDMSIGYNVTNIQLNSSNTNDNKEQQQQQQQHEQSLPLHNNNNTLPITLLNPNDNTTFKSKPPFPHNEQQQHHSNQQPLLLISQEHSFTISTIPKPKPSLSISNTYSNQIILSKHPSLSLPSHSNHNTNNKQHKPYSTTKENNLLFKSIDPSKRFKKEFNRIIRVSYGDEFMLPSKPPNKQEQSYITRTTTTGSTCTSGRDSNRKGTQIQTSIISKKIITETNIEILPKAHKPKKETFVIMNENVFDINSYHKSFNVNEMKTQQNVIEFNNEHKPKKQNEIQRLNDMIFEIHVPSSSMHKGFHKEKIEISKGDDMLMCYKNKLFDFGNIVVDKGNEFTECNNGNNSNNKDKCELIICSSDIKYEIVRQSKVNDNTFEIINSETIMMSSKYKHFDVSGIVVEQNECFTNNNNNEHTTTTTTKDKQYEITLNDQLEFISNNEKKDDITKQDKEILYEITNSDMFNVESKNKTFNTNAFVIEQNEQFTDEHIKQEIELQIQTLPHSQVNIISPIIPLNDNITQTELLLLSSANEIASCDSFIMINNHKQFNTSEIVIEHNEAFTEENIPHIIKQYTTHFENEFEMLAYNLRIQQQEQTTQTEISPLQHTQYHIINNTPQFTITTHNKHFNTNAFTIEQNETFTQQFPINNAYTHTSSPLLISQSLPITLISRNKSFPLTSLHVTDSNVLSSTIFPKAKPPLSITPLIPLTYTAHIPSSLFNHSSLSTSQSSFSIKHQHQDEQQQTPSTTTATVTNTVIPLLQPLHFSTNKLNPYSNHSLSIISPRTHTSQLDSPYKHMAFTVSTENLFQYTNNISSQKKFITLTQSNQETDIVFPRSKESNYSCSVLSPSRQRDSLIKESFDFEFGTLIDNSNRNSSNTTNTKTITDLETTHNSSFELLNDPKQYVTTKAKNFKRGNVENISFILKSKIKSPFWNENLRVDSLQSPLILNETLAFTPIIDSRSLKQYVVSPQHEMNVHYCTIKEICEDDITIQNNNTKYKKQFKYKQHNNNNNNQCSYTNEEYVKEEFAFSFMPKQCDVSVNQVKTVNNVFTVSDPNSISVSFVPVPKQVTFTEHKLMPIEHIELSINANSIDLEQHSQQQQQEQQQLMFANNNNTNTNEPHVVIRTLETLEQDDLFNNSSNVPDIQVDNNNNTSKSNNTNTNTNNNALNMMILTTPHESPQINTLPITTHNFTHLEITSSPSNILFIPPTYSPTTSSSQLKQLPPHIQSPLNTLPKTNLKPLATTSHPPSSHNSNSNLRSERMNSEECSYNDLSSGNRMLNRAFNKYFYDYIKSSNNNNNNSINLDNINPNTNSNNINSTNTNNNNNNNYFNIESARSPWGILNDHNISVVSMDNYLNQNTFDFAYENFQFISPSTQLKDNPIITTTTNNKQMEDKQTSTDLPEIIITHLNDKQIITDDALANYDKGDIDNDCENEGDGGAMLKRSGSVINEKAPIRRKLLNRKLKKKDSRGNSGELSASSANSNNNMNYQFTSVLQNNKGELKKPRSQNNLLQFRNRTLDINNSLSYSKAEAKSEDSTPKSTSNQANFIMEANHIEMLSKPMQCDNNIESENKCVQTEPHLFSYCVSKVNDDIQINGVQSNTTTTRSSEQFQSNQIQKAFLPILLTRIWNTHLKRYGIRTLSYKHNNNNNITTKPSYIPIQSTTFSIPTSKPLSPPHIIISNENTLTFPKTPFFPQLKHKLTRIINVLYKTKPLHKRFTKWNLNATILNISTHLLKLKMNNINKEHQITFTYDYSNSYLHYKKPHDDINKDYRKQPSKTNSVVEFDEPFDTFRGACSCSEKITPKSDKSQMSSESSIKKLNSITQSQTLQIPYQHVNENNILKKTYFYYYSDIIKLAMCMNKWNKKSKTISNLHKQRIHKLHNVYINKVNKQCYNLLKKCIMKWKIKKIIIKPPSFKHHPHKSSVNKSEVNKHNIITLNNSNSIISNNNSNLNSNRTNNKKDSFSSDYSPILTSKPLDNTNNTVANTNTNTNNDSSPVKTIRVKKVPRSKKTMSKTVGSFIHPSTDDKWELKMTQHNSPGNTKYKGMKVIHRYVDVTSKDNNNNNTKNDNNKFIGGSISNYNNLQQNQINMIIQLNNIFIKSCLVISFNKWKYIKMRTQIGMIIDTQTKCSKTLNLFLILLYLYTHNMYVETPRGLDKKLLAKVKVMFIWYRKVLLHKKKLNI